MQIQKTETPKRILAIKLRELGDTAIWTSALEGLHKLFPQTEIHVLVPPGGKELLLHHPVVKQLHVISSTRALGIILKLIELRKYRFDLALGFHATTSLCRWIRLLGAKRVGLHHHSWTFTPKNSDLSIEKPGFLQGAIARDYELLNCLGWDGPVLSTHLQVLDSERAEATKWLKATKLALDSSRPLLALLPGARAETRRYPKDLWREMALHLQSEGKYQVYVIADANLSREWELSRLCREMGLPLFDQLNLRQFMAVLSFASKAVANDSGPLHIAAALGVSTVALFGPGCVGDWHPYEGSQFQVLRAVVDCRTEGPSDQDAFRYCTVVKCDHLSCLRRLSPESVVSALEMTPSK